jgi:prepilin-type N-terminal cleavage/methylation domain-containing protein
MREEKSGDAGFTLIDMMMAMTVMSVVMAVFTASVVRMYRTANDVESRSVAQTQLGVGMQRLEREVRYAQGISEPYPVSGATYADMLVIQNNGRQCLQLRVAGGVLAQRTWTYQADPLDLTGWTVLASGVSSTTPFDYLPPTETLGHQQLTVALTAGTGTAKDANSETFTALNSDRTTGQDYCAAVRGLTP